MNCPKCAQALSETARFCSSCGHSTALANAATVSIGDRETADDARPAADPLVGRVLDDKYEIVARLGGGGMGTVYRARRVHIGDEVAVKVLRAEYVLEADAVERFRREARSAAMIRHANVVTIHDLSAARGAGTPAYIVMELVRGASLRELLNHEGRLAPSRAVALMRDICAGVGVAHRLGLVHRDLKPDNVIVVPATEDERETAKVVDFGLAKARDMAQELRLTQAGTVLGTPYYMSPEQCRGEELDARADVYSLGALFYEMLAGTPPFSAGSLGGLIAKHLNDAPPAMPPHLNVPPALEAVCRRALAKNPAERQPDATVLSREIQAALLPPTVATPPPAQVESSAVITPPASLVAPAQTFAPPPQAQTHRAKWVAAGLLLSLLGVLVTGAAIWRMRASDADSDKSATKAQRTRVTATPAPSAENAGADDTNAAGPDNSAAETAPTAGAQGLTGKWAGTYGPMGSPATLTVKEEKGGKLSGVLEQGGVRVAFVGSVDAATRQVTIKETRVLSGSGWSLGENTGELSADGRTMSGTGGDAMSAQLGLSYSWSFTRQQSKE